MRCLHVFLSIAPLIHSRCARSFQKEGVTSVEMDGWISSLSLHPSQETNGPPTSSSFLYAVTTSSLRSPSAVASPAFALIPTTTSYFLSNSSSTTIVPRYTSISSPIFSEHHLSITSDFTLESLEHPSSNIVALASTTQTLPPITPPSLATFMSTEFAINYNPTTISSSTSILQTNTDPTGSGDMSTSISRPTETALAIFAFLTILIVAIFLFQKWRSRRGSSNEDFWPKYDDFVNKDEEKAPRYPIGRPNPFDSDDTPAGSGDLSSIEKNAEPFQPQFMKGITLRQANDHWVHPTSFMKVSCGKMQQDDRVCSGKLPPDPRRNRNLSP